MLYDSKSCSNSYYWSNFQTISSLLILIPLLVFIIYGIYLIFTNKSKNKVKFEFIPTLICAGLYLIGLLLFLNKDINQIFGIVLISIGSIGFAFLRKNISYLLLTFIIPFIAKENFKMMFAWINIILLTILTYFNIKKLNPKEKKLTYIMVAILFVLFIVGIILLVYINNNRPEGYCWGAA